MGVFYRDAACRGSHFLEGVMATARPAAPAGVGHLVVEPQVERAARYGHRFCHMGY